MTKDNIRRLKSYLARVLLIVVVLSSVCKSYKVSRPINNQGKSTGDKFQKGTYVYQNKIIRITDCNSVRGGAINNGKNYCKCYQEATFYINTSSSLPTCTVGYGKDDFGCQFKFLTPANSIKIVRIMTGMNKDIGTVRDGYDSVERIQEISSVSIWNITWQLQQGTLFRINQSKLQWASMNPVQIASNYSGVLFKINLVVVRGGPRSGCVLFKVNGSRDYQLQPYVRRSSTTMKPETTTVIKSKLPSITTSATSIIMSTSQNERPRIPSTSVAITPTPSYTKTSSLSTSSKELTSEPRSPTISPTKSTRAYLTTTPRRFSSHSSMLTSKVVTESTTIKQSSFQSIASSSYRDYATSTINLAMSTDFVASSTTSSKLPTSSIITNPGVNAGKQQSSNAGMIAGTSVGVIVAIAAVFAFVFIYRRRLGRRHPSLDEIRRRKGTMTLDLTANTFSNRGLSFQNPVKKDVGNPMYTDKLRFNSVSANGESNTELYEYAYENGKKQDEKPGEAIYKEIDDDGKMEPIYREIETEEPIYHETESEYQPIDETKLDSPAKYEALNTAALPKEEPSYLKPVQAPIYQELEEENSAVDKTKDEPSVANLVQAPIYQVLEEENYGKHNNNRNAKNEAQSPVYQTLNPEVYVELDRSSTKSPDAVYSKLDLGDKNRPKQEPLYDVLARGSGTSNIQYDDDEAEI